MVVFFPDQIVAFRASHLRVNFVLYLIERVSDPHDINVPVVCFTHKVTVKIMQDLFDAKIK
jgi:hypothetical protein